MVDEDAVIASSHAIAAGQSVSVRVPATSANLGPGFDSLGLALSLYDVLSVSTVENPGVAVTVTGEGETDLPRDERHLSARIMLEIFDAAGFTVRGLILQAQNRIPHGRGLGSSAAAVVSAALAANTLLPPTSRMNDDELLQFCAGKEGHPDNVAPALLGALAISWHDGERFASSAAPVHAGVSAVVAIPTMSLSTTAARGLLPAQISHAVAAANAGRAALLIHALSNNPDLLMPATVDRLHQQYRAGAMQESARLLKRLREQGFAAVISGAGPTVAVLVRNATESERTEAAVLALLGREAGEDYSPRHRSDNWRVLRLDVDGEGARVEVHHG